MIPTGDLDQPATIAALAIPGGFIAWDDTMPACEAACGNVAERAHFDALTERFVALCVECEPIPFTLTDTANGDNAALSRNDA